VKSLLFGRMGLEDGHQFAFESGDVDDFFFYWNYIFLFILLWGWLDGGLVFVVDALFFF
jgi:hypothetical protein